MKKLGPSSSYVPRSEMYMKRERERECLFSVGGSIPKDEYSTLPVAG